MRHLIKLVFLSFALLLAPNLWGVDIIANNKDATEGKSIDYPITIEDANLLGGIGFTVLFDPTLLELDDLTNGELASNALMEYNEIEPGKVLVSIVDANGMNGDGELVLFKFKTKGVVGDYALISVEDARAYDIELLDVPFNLKSGNISIVEGSTIALPGIKIEYIIIGVLVLLVAFLFGRMGRKRAMAH